MDILLFLGVLALNIQLYKLASLILLVSEQSKDLREFDHGKHRSNRSDN